MNKFLLLHLNLIYRLIYINILLKPMKTKFTIFTLLILVSSILKAQEVIDNYTMSYFNKNYDIEASMGKNGDFTVYIQVSAERVSTKANYMIKSDRLHEFKEALLFTRDKYVEWAKIAKDNNVTDMTKNIDAKFPNIDIAWLSSKWFFLSVKNYLLHL